MSNSHDAPPDERIYEAPDDSARHARYGLILFFLYLGLYAAFLVINTFRPQMMDWVPAAGVSLSVWYGFGLIVAALALALVYCWVCRSGREAR